MFREVFGVLLFLDKLLELLSLFLVGCNLVQDIHALQRQLLQVHPGGEEVISQVITILVM